MADDSGGISDILLKTPSALNELLLLLDMNR